MPDPDEATSAPLEDEVVSAATSEATSEEVEVDTVSLPFAAEEVAGHLSEAEVGLLQDRALDVAILSSAMQTITVDHLLDLTMPEQVHHLGLVARSRKPLPPQLHRSGPAITRLLRRTLEARVSHPAANQSQMIRHGSPAHRQALVHLPLTYPIVLIPQSRTCQNPSRAARKQNRSSIAPNSTSWRMKQRSYGRSSRRRKRRSGKD